MAHDFTYRIAASYLLFGPKLTWRLPSSALGGRKCLRYRGAIVRRLTLWAFARGRRPVGSGGRRPPFGTGIDQVAGISAQQGLAAGSTRLGSHLQIIESALCELVAPETLVDSPPETLLPAAFPAGGVCQVVSFASREVGRADGENCSPKG
jgi:hypothetical protein